MTEIEIKDVHIGREIDKRREELAMSKSELARQMGIRQQHINHLLGSETIETKRLVKISKILRFNFFSLYFNNPMNISQICSSLSLGEGDSFTLIGSDAIATQIKLQQQKIESMDENRNILKEQIASLKSQIKLQESTIKEKDDIIAHYKELASLNKS